MATRTYTAEEVRQRLDRLPRLRLAALPTPLQDMDRLSAQVGGPHLLIKREDLTGLAMGGNKIREFEYSLAPAVEGEYDVLVHSAAAQSNQSRQTAAVAARLGLEAVQVGRYDEHAHIQGNLLLTHLFGAEVLLPPAAEQQDAVQARLEQLRQAGRRPYNTSTDGFVFRSVAYVDGFLELWSQLEQRQVVPDAVYLCSGAHTHVGLVVGARALGIELRVVGISPSPRDDAETAARLADLARRNAAALDLELEFEPGDFESYAEFVGPDYGVLTEASRQAIHLLARTEGLLLDPCYTGKAMAGLLAHIRGGWWGPEHRIVFIHTGGTPALFAYADELGLGT